MTGDQRLISRIEQVQARLSEDEVIAAYHLLDELVDELANLAREAADRPLPRDARASERIPAVAAG